jgi:hypothetical protein
MEGVFQIQIVGFSNLIQVLAFAANYFSSGDGVAIYDNTFMVISLVSRYMLAQSL